MPTTAAASNRPEGLLGFANSPVPASLLTAVFCFAVCYFRAFVSLNIPIILWGDQVGFFNNGSRLALGELPFRDYFVIVPPGTDLAYAILIKCFGLRASIPNLLMGCLAAIAAFLMTKIATHLMRGPIILLPALLFAGFILVSASDATHHWFSTIAILGATLVLLDGITLRRVALAGGLCGVAACFTQTKGVFAILAMLTYLAYHLRRSVPSARERWRKYAVLCGVAALVFVGVNAYFIRAAGIGKWLYCLVVFPIRYYPVPAINNWRVVMYDYRYHNGFAPWLNIAFLYATVPLIYIVFFFVTCREWKSHQGAEWDKLLLVVLTGIGMFLAVGSSPSAKRLGTVSPPALILLAWLLHRPGIAVARLRIVLAVLAAVLAVGITLRLQTRQWFFLDLPAGRAALRDRALYEEYRWTLGHTQPGQYVFGMAPFYSAFHLRNPCPIEGFQDSVYTRPQQVRAVVDSLESHHVQLLVLPRSSDVLNPGTSRSDHLDPLRTYLKENYRVIKTFPSTDGAWIRIQKQD